jgi:NTP pyrophosphatase (non-canonical NTP hydrolase)
MEHFNKLTPAEAERLAMLAEECGEVIQIVGKILRHGYDCYHPEDPTKTNRQLLGRELTDLYAVASSLCRDRVPEGSLHEQNLAWERKLRFAHHQEELPGILNDRGE